MVDSQIDLEFEEFIDPLRELLGTMASDVYGKMGQWLVSNGEVTRGFIGEQPVTRYTFATANDFR